MQRLRVVIRDSDSGNAILFLSSFCNAHALRVDMNGDKHTWILDAGASFHLAVSDHVVTINEQPSASLWHG